MKNNSMKKTTVLTTIICLIPVVIGIILYPQLPDTIVTHWDASGNPNGWSPKLLGAIGFPAILAALNLLVPVLLKMDPKYENINEKTKMLIHWILPLVSVFCSGSTLASAMGMDAKVMLIAPVLMGVIFVMIGNYLPKMSQSYTVGIKLPWTLHSEENWNRTHRLAGILWVIGGIVIVIAGLLGMGFVVFVAAMLVMILVPTIYSFVLYRKGV